MTVKINYKRMLDTFIKLTKIESTSFNELNMQLAAEAELKALGCRVTHDNAGSKFKTTAKGNVIGLLPGTIKSAPFILCSHLDTVTPCKKYSCSLFAYTKSSQSFSTAESLFSFTAHLYPL